MKAKKASGKQIASIILLAASVVFLVFGALGLAGGGGMDPYEARNSVVMVYSYLQLTDGQSAGAMGTGFAIGKPGEPVEYIVTNGHVVEYGYVGPKEYQGQVASAGVQIYFSAAENDYVTAEVVYYSPFNEKDIAIIRLPSKAEKRFPSRMQIRLPSATPPMPWDIRAWQAATSSLTPTMKMTLP